MKLLDPIVDIEAERYVTSLSSKIEEDEIECYNRHQLKDAVVHGALSQREHDSKVIDTIRHEYDDKIVKTIDAACDIYVDKLTEFIPELLGYGGMVKHLENEFRTELQDKLCSNKQ